MTTLHGTAAYAYSQSVQYVQQQSYSAAASVVPAVGIERYLQQLADLGIIPVGLVGKLLHVATGVSSSALFYVVGAASAAVVAASYVVRWAYTIFSHIAACVSAAADMAFQRLEAEIDLALRTWREDMYLKLKSDAADYAKAALTQGLAAALSLVPIAAPYVFPLMGHLDFMAFAPYNPFVQWRLAGLNVFQWVAAAKRWKCFPAYLVILKYTTESRWLRDFLSKLGEMFIKRVPEKVRRFVRGGGEGGGGGGTGQSVTPGLGRALAMGRVRGLGNAAYRVGYMLERLMEDDELARGRLPKRPDMHPYKGLIVHAAGFHLITDREPPGLLVRYRSISRFFEFFRDGEGRWWAYHDGFGTNDPELEPDGVTLFELDGRTWIDEGVDGLLRIITSPPRYVSLRVASRAQRLLMDLETLLYFHLWAKDLRLHGYDVPVPKMTHVHYDAVERHIRFFESLA